MKPKIVSKLTDRGYPYHDRHYREAHAEADKAEKKQFPKGYQQLKHKEKFMDKNELMGKNERRGKIEVEKKYKKYEREISYHEKKEHEALKRLDKKNKKSP
jgi:hypothetical protein